MDWKCNILVNVGYKIVSTAGPYCCAYRGNNEVILRWDGERWLVL